MKYQRGISIVEIMIALAISLIILLAISRAYVAGSTTQQAQTDVTRLNESARYTTDILSKAIRKAGFRNAWIPNPPSNSNVQNTVCTSPPSGGATVRLIEGLNDATTINPTQITNVLGTGTTAVVNSSDALRVRYYGDVAPATGGSSQIKDCQGYDVTPNAMSVDTFYVAIDTSSIDTPKPPTLFCVTNNTANPNAGTAIPLVSGVESLQLLYGEDTDANPDGIINHYVPWNLLANTNNPDSILGIKISVVVRSPKEVAITPPQAPFNHFSTSAVTYPVTVNNDNGAIFTPPSDRRIRLMFSTEVAMRNYRYCE